jgi:hypothetical protein
MFDLRRFCFRSPERDRKTDERRIALVQNVVRSAVADAEAEATRLRARMANARRSAIFLVRDDSGESGPTRRSELTSFEQHLLAAEQRLAQLRDHLAFLRTIEVASTRLPH